MSLEYLHSLNAQEPCSSQHFGLRLQKYSPLATKGQWKMEQLLLLPLSELQTQNSTPKAAQNLLLKVDRTSLMRAGQMMMWKECRWYWRWHVSQLTWLGRDS